MSDENRETKVRRYQMIDMQDKCDDAQSRRDLIHTRTTVHTNVSCLGFL